MPQTIKPTLLAFAILSVVALSGCTSSLEVRQAAFWDIVIKAVGGAVALGGAFITAATFLRDKRASTEALLESARRPFREKRQEVFDDLLRQTSRIGNTRHGTPERQAAVDDFWFNYWGPLPLVADSAVGAAADAFAEALDRPAEEVPLRNRSMDLAHACRKTLAFVDDEPSEAGAIVQLIRNSIRSTAR
jgi:hypothetical protein